MNKGFPSRETVARLREQYPEGTWVELISMNDPHTTLRPGDKGRVSLVDDTGTPTGAGARFDPPKWLVPGDVIEVTAEGIGALRNGVRDE